MGELFVSVSLLTGEPWSFADVLCEEVAEELAIAVEGGFVSQHAAEHILARCEAFHGVGMKDDK